MTEVLPVGEVCTRREPFEPSPVAATTDVSRRGTSARWDMLNSFTDRSMSKLRSAEVKVWIAIFRDNRDGISRTAQTDLARRAGVNVRTAQRAISALVKRKLIEVVRRGSVEGGPSHYKIRGV